MAFSPAAKKLKRSTTATPNLFRPLESIGVQEILVRTEEEALALREEVERGG